MRLLSENEQLHNKELMSDAVVNKFQMAIYEEEAIQPGISCCYPFKKGKIRRTRFNSITWLVQNITVSAFRRYLIFFYTQAGFSTSITFAFLSSNMLLVCLVLYLFGSCLKN